MILLPIDYLRHEWYPSMNSSTNIKNIHAKYKNKQPHPGSIIVSLHLPVWDEIKNISYRQIWAVRSYMNIAVDKTLVHYRKIKEKQCIITGSTLKLTSIMDGWFLQAIQVCSELTSSFTCMWLHMKWFAVKNRGVVVWIIQCSDDYKDIFTCTNVLAYMPICPELIVTSSHNSVTVSPLQFNILSSVVASAHTSLASRSWPCHMGWLGCSVWLFLYIHPPSPNRNMTAEALFFRHFLHPALYGVSLPLRIMFSLKVFPEQEG